MSSQKLSDKIGFFRVERPSEWLMDEFKRDAELLEKHIKDLEEGLMDCAAARTTKEACEIADKLIGGDV